MTPAPNFATVLFESIEVRQHRTKLSDDNAMENSSIFELLIMYVCFNQSSFKVRLELKPFETASKICYAAYQFYINPKNM
mmetsp:Transcript_108482/g.221529  ORF Transcript_108482/g.221529 Transcript_108482/m.221529 type:complete len:80 (+) Transcript_108482:850-1089(+)